MVEAKLTEVTEQARVTVESRGTELVDERLKDAVDALAARDAEILDVKLTDALESIRALGSETVEAGLRVAFERALGASQHKRVRNPKRQAKARGLVRAPSKDDESRR
jgi:hypothetical protein